MSGCVVYLNQEVCVCVCVFCFCFWFALLMYWGLCNLHVSVVWGCSKPVGKSCVYVVPFGNVRVFGDNVCGGLLLVLFMI